MSQPDLITQLLDARPQAPAELRERVALLAAEAAPARTRRSFAWRRAFTIAVPVAAAAVAAVAFLPGGSSPRIATPPVESLPYSPTSTDAVAGGVGAAQQSAAASATARTAIPAPNPQRIQRIEATLQLRVPDSQAVSDDTKRAVAMAQALGGYTRSVNENASGRIGYATIVLRIPRRNVQKAVARLSTLGAVIGENVAIADLQTGVDATARKIARLNHALATWKAQYPTTVTAKHVTALTAQIAHLKLAQAATIRTASYATVSVELTTRPAPIVKTHGHGPLHGLGIIFHWAWVAAVYALALGAPVALLAALGWWIVRATRRRRDERLLATP